MLVLWMVPSLERPQGGSRVDAVQSSHLSTRSMPASTSGSTSWEL